MDGVALGTQGQRGQYRIIALLSASLLCIVIIWHFVGNCTHNDELSFVTNLIGCRLCSLFSN
jgi:hypothetical protein